MLVACVGVRSIGWAVLRRRRREPPCPVSCSLALLPLFAIRLLVRSLELARPRSWLARLAALFRIAQAARIAAGFSYTVYTIAQVLRQYYRARHISRVSRSLWRQSRRICQPRIARCAPTSRPAHSRSRPFAPPAPACRFAPSCALISFRALIFHAHPYTIRPPRPACQSKTG